MSKSILIVDDDKLVRRVLRSFVESRTHFDVCGEAVNGIDALEKARTLNPDLIVMDLSMPVMNGLEAGAVLKAMLPKVPIVMYTVHDTAGMKVQALAAGVRAFIQRHDMDGLAGHLRELLE
jgi:two-component system, NarL family, nitrate/nitrite response regulator NarL